jgi:hypothetical protein
LSLEWRRCEEVVHGGNEVKKCRGDG